MWWDEFEIRLTNVFAIFDKGAGRQIHTEKSKLRILNKKIRADFLTTMKTTIEIHMSITPMTMTNSSALSNYRNTINQRLTNESTVKRDNRRIQTASSLGGIQVRGVRGHQGRGRRGGHGGLGRGTVGRNGDWEVTGLNGRTHH